MGDKSPKPGTPEWQEWFNNQVEDHDEEVEDQGQGITVENDDRNENLKWEW
jgi:hypothetical protein